jgi:acetone carboxylase gamma subunit
MARIQEYLEEDTSGGQRAFRCAKCGHALGTAADYRTVAGTYDESINSYEPVALNTRDHTFVLRHYCCPSCGVLFEVEMVSRVAG